MLLLLLLLHATTGEATRELSLDMICCYYFLGLDAAVIGFFN